MEALLSGPIAMKFPSRRFNGTFVSVSSERWNLTSKKLHPSPCSAAYLPPQDPAFDMLLQFLACFATRPTAREMSLHHNSRACMAASSPRASSRLTWGSLLWVDCYHLWCSTSSSSATPSLIDLCSFGLR